jgi:hypothetical protein
MIPFAPRGKKGNAMEGLARRVVPAVASSAALAAVVALASPAISNLIQSQSLPSSGQHTASFHVTTLADPGSASPDVLKLLQ